MQHVEAYGFAPLYGFESGGLRLAVDGHQLLLQLEVDAVARDIVHQRGDIGLDPEQHAARIAKLDVDRIEHAAFGPCVARQVHRLLRCARAFDRHWRLAEDRAARFEVTHQLPGVRRKIVAIVGGHAVAAECFFEPLDLLPREPDAGSDDEQLVFDRAAVIECDPVRLRLERSGRPADPMRALGHHAGHRATGYRCIEHAPAHHCPARLIVMFALRLDDRDVEQRSSLEQRCGGRDAPGTAADDDDVMR